VTTLRLAGVEVPRVGLGTNRLTTAPEHTIELAWLPARSPVAVPIAESLAALEVELCDVDEVAA
jgi:hypothetical protein